MLIEVDNDKAKDLREALELAAWMLDREGVNEETTALLSDLADKL